MVVLCCIVVVTGFLPFPVSRSSLSSPPSQVVSLCFVLVFVAGQFLVFLAYNRQPNPRTLSNSW